MAPFVEDEKDRVWGWVAAECVSTRILCGEVWSSIAPATFNSPTINMNNSRHAETHAHKEHYPIFATNCVDIGRWPIARVMVAGLTFSENALVSSLSPEHLLKICTDKQLRGCWETFRDIQNYSDLGEFVSVWLTTIATTYVGGTPLLSRAEPCTLANLRFPTLYPIRPWSQDQYRERLETWAFCAPSS